MAAVRGATAPAPTEPSGTPPYTSGPWLFAHNGAVDGFRPIDELTDGQPDTAPEGRTTGAAMHYTSGTTGRPKGAVHAHAHLVATAELYAIPYLDLGPDDVVFSAAKLFFAYGLGNGLTFPMAVGATTVLLEGPPTAAAVGEVLIEYAERFPAAQIEVYCGHTHGAGVSQLRENLRVFTGAAEYGAPRRSGTISIA